MYGVLGVSNYMVVSKEVIHFTVLYSLTFMVFLFVLISFSSSDNQGEWLCVEETCLETSPVGEAWITENCGDFQTEQGDVIMACQLMLDGEERIVPFDSLNLSAIQVCAVSQCVQEIRVRTPQPNNG